MFEKEKDSEKLFSTTKKVLGWFMSGPPSGLKVEGKMVRKQIDLANIQASYYVDKVQKIKIFLPKVNFDPLGAIKITFGKWCPARGKPKFSMKSITNTEVLEMIRNLKTSHVFGRDRIDGATIKLIGPIISKVITHVINLSLGTQQFPAKWKFLKGKNWTALIRCHFVPSVSFRSEINIYYPLRMVHP